MRRLLALLSLPLVLAACGGGSRTTQVACSVQFWNGTVGVCLPNGWDVIPRETLSERGLPNEVAAAFQAKEAVSGQFPTVTVTEENLPNPVDSAPYSKASIRAVSTLPGYKLIDTRDVSIDGDTVDLHIFTAQPLNEEPQRRFYQISVVNGEKGYTFTALTPVSISNALEAQVLRIVQSGTFKDPSASSEAAT